MTDYQKQLVTDNHNLIYRFLQKEKLNLDYSRRSRESG